MCDPLAKDDEDKSMQERQDLLTGASSFSRGACKKTWDVKTKGDELETDDGGRQGTIPHDGGGEGKWQGLQPLVVGSGQWCPVGLGRFVVQKRLCRAISPHDLKSLRCCLPLRRRRCLRLHISATCLRHLQGALEPKCEELIIDIPPIEEWPKCYIYKVPKKLHMVKEKAYTPKSVSIGPFHHKLQESRGVKMQKLKYLKKFCLRTGKSQKDLASIIEKKEEKILTQESHLSDVCFSYVIECNVSLGIHLFHRKLVFCEIKTFLSSH
ncbi:uncharacterized protein LOC132165925 [Corylus avellana]|uniref:uncharacterized protein LOC132165925 n=1 Tax=Corylus avellana TaxID=13451 RepID=UPI00286D559A|nr:uncharacterized protein LOC132165925 [Corylus avellana]